MNRKILVSLIITILAIGTMLVACGGDDKDSGTATTGTTTATTGTTAEADAPQSGSFRLISGSDATMIGALSDAINNNEWVVVTGWTPHWKFGRWDLKYLEDPKNIFGDPENINTIVRKGLKEDMPVVYEVLDNFYWTPDDLAVVMVWNQEDNADPYESAKRWVNENADKVNEWIPAGADANTGQGQRVNLLYVEWSCAIGATNVVQAVLQERLGYNVTITPVSAAAMWMAMGTGDGDGMVTAWLPTTHGEYYNRVKDDIVDLGPNLEGTSLGLIVPDYVTINSIPELIRYQDNFRGRIIGIDPGAGLMGLAATAMNEYNLGNPE